MKQHRRFFTWAKNTQIVPVTLSQTVPIPSLLSVQARLTKLAKGSLIGFVLGGCGSTDLQGFAAKQGRGIQSQLASTGANTPPNILKTNLPSGEVEVSLTGSGTLFYTLDGTVPLVQQNGQSANSSTVVFKQPFRVSENSVVRAVSVNAGKVSVMRSSAVYTRVWNAKLVHFPHFARPVKAVYVTGPFRNWSTVFDDKFRLNPQTDGTFTSRLVIDRTQQLDYKFIIRYQDETFDWAVDESQPVAGQAPYNNNFMRSGRAEIASKFLPYNDGLIDEAALDLAVSPVAALDAGENLVRVKVGVLDGDLEKISLRFPDATQNFDLVKTSTYQTEGVTFASYSGLVKIPSTSVNTRFVFSASDKNQQYFLGPAGIISGDPFANERLAFPFQYNAETRKLNNADLYQIPLWAVDAIWYQIFPERFRNGDTSNDVVGQYPTEWQKSFPALNQLKRTISPWTSSWFSFTPDERNMERIVKETQPQLEPREIQRQIIFTRRYGGDIQGVRDSVPYLKSLGVNGIYFNPVFDSDSLHRYDTKDYRHVDAKLGRMGTNAAGEKVLLQADLDLLAREDFEDPSTWGYTSADLEFISLVADLQKSGMHVVIDGVFNHSAANGPMVDDIARKGKGSRFYDWFATSYEGDPDFYSRKCPLSEFFPDAAQFPFANKIRFDSWAGFCPLINHRQGFPGGSLHPGLRKHIFDITERWFAPKKINGIDFKGVDGIRLDVYGEVPADFWRLFRSKVKAINPNALIVAEEWYDGLDILQGDQVDGLMNYTARTLAESWFVNTDPTNRFRPSWAKGFVDYRMNAQREHVKHGLWTMLSSHDTDRIISKTILQNRSLCLKPQEGNSWDADVVNKADRGALYSNDKPGVLEKELYKAIVAFQMSYVGAPVIYYGDEVGMWGADDPTDRKPMVWDDLSNGTQFETQCVSQPGTWCLENPAVRFSVEQDKDLLATYKRLIDARKTQPALRRGRLNSELQVSMAGQTLALGTTATDNTFLWGYERNFGDSNFAYFVSNQNLNSESQSFKLKTRFVPGKSALEVVSGRTYRVEADGSVSVSLGRDRAVLFIQK